MSTAQVLCRYYASGCCKREDCGFLHDFKGRMNMSCTFFLQGQCTYGSKCRYDHVRPKKSQETTTTTNGTTRKPQGYPKRVGTVSLGRDNPTRQAQDSAKAPLSTHTQPNTQPHTQQPRNATQHTESHHSTGERSTSVGSGIAPLSTDAPAFQPNQPYRPITTNQTQTHTDTAAHPSTTTPTKATAGITTVNPGMSFAGAAKSGVTYAQPAAAEAETVESAAEKALRDALLCPFAMAGKCAFAVGRCKYMHGDVCVGCGGQCLHPHNTQQRTQHHATCQGSARPPPPDDGLTAEMYASSGGTGDFEDTTGHAATGDADGGSIPLAPETECGICMDIVEDKEVLSDRRYGLLEGCTHCFCLHCIRRWRADKNKDNARKCPMCKQPSHYVVPSTAWPRSVSERHHIIQTYQQSLKRTKCMYYAKGASECPFGTSCFYRHENPDGTEAQVRLRHYDGQEGPQIHRDYRLWDYLAQAEAPE